MNLIKTKFILLFILAISFIACEKELKNDINFIENLSNNETSELPFYNESVKIYIKIDGIVYRTRLRQLYFLREEKYNDYGDFDEFLVQAINGNLLSKSDLDKKWIQAFTPDKKIMSEFSSNGLAYLITKYCKNAQVKNKYFMKKNLQWDVEQTILFIFFKNNYYVTEDDFLGNSVFPNRDFLKSKRQE